MSATTYPDHHAAPPAQPFPFSRWIDSLVDPAVFDFWAGQVNPTWTWSRPLARIVARRVEALDTVTLTLAPNRHCLLPLPGQHLNVSAAVNGRRTTRSYSVTNVPSANRRLEITVKRVDGGKLSTHLCRHACPGDVLELGAPFGDVVLPANPTGNWLFLAAGSGITPLISLTRALAQRDMPINLTLIYWAKTRAELCFTSELQQLAARHPSFTLHTMTTDSHSRISQEQLAQLAWPLAGKHVRACGPSGFVASARALTKEAATSFEAESFTPLAAVAATDDQTPVQLHLLQSGRTVEVSSAKTLLAALEEQGIHPASGCRMGVCRTCVCTKRSGTTQDTLTGEQDTESGSDVRLCVSRATSDLTLDL